MRLLVVCQHYWPEDFQVTAVCEDLVKRGHEVTVLCGLPNYPTGVVQEEYRHGGNRFQEKDGVRIVRSFEIGRRPSALGLALNYYSYSWSASRAVRKLDREFDAVFAYQLSPVFMANPAVVCKKRLGIPLLLYCCDLWPESMKVLIGDRAKPLLSHYKKVSNRIYQAADVLAVQSSAFTEYFEVVHGILPNRIEYVPHFASDSYLKQDFSCAPHDGVNFVFTGNIGRAQDVPCILQAVAAMCHQKKFMVHFVGDGACLESAKHLARELGIEDRIEFHGRKPFSEMPRYYRMADVCLLTLDGTSWVGATLPSKLQGYMAAGKPILAAVNGGARAVVEEAECGRAVPAGDAKGLAALMDDYLDNPQSYDFCGDKGRRYFRRHFMREQHVSSIENVLIKLVERN